MVPMVATNTVDHKDPVLLMVTNRTEGTVDQDQDVISLEVPALNLDQVLSVVPALK